MKMIKEAIDTVVRAATQVLDDEGDLQEALAAAGTELARMSQDAGPPAIRSGL